MAETDRQTDRQTDRHHQLWTQPPRGWLSENHANWYFFEETRAAKLTAMCIYSAIILSAQCLANPGCYESVWPSSLE